ncbi:hypothetical protein BSKO_08661 [Bryopsis sp. KO-2023]|nr:hypothetical protein BSKO_08661 [Bryopsis sp. KO-2023]
MSAIVKYMKEVTGKSSFGDLFKSVGLFSFLDGKLAETVLSHGPGGTLMGSDDFGNQYYERKTNTQYGRHRWVVYAEKRTNHYTPATVPAEWHGWLHFISDDAPTVVPPNFPIYRVKHVPNPTMSDDRYLPKGSWFKAGDKRNWEKFEAWKA